MKRYELQEHQDMNHTFYVIRNLDTMEWFAGYAFMGGADWVASPADSYEMSKEEALDVLEDLVASDDEQKETFGGTEYTKDELIGLALTMAVQQAKEWRSHSDDSESWEHYDLLVKAFETLKEQNPA